MATDGHVVSPLFFPGGDIGCLAVHGTINDVAVMGARPLYLAASFILEEGFALAELVRIVESMASAAREAGVPVVTGDTKVVEAGKGDGVFISTTGVGALPAGRDIGGANARAGDVVIVSGSIGDHGTAILSQRESLAFDTEIVSDTAALHGLIAHLLEMVPGCCMCCATPPVAGWPARSTKSRRQSQCRDQPRRGGDPRCMPQVEAACEFLGLDPLYVANEGKLVVICAAADADAALSALRSHPLGAEAAAHRHGDR